MGQINDQNQSGSAVLLLNGSVQFQHKNTDEAEIITSGSDLVPGSGRVSPVRTSSEQQARTQSRSDRTVRAIMATASRLSAALTLMAAP